MIADALSTFDYWTGAILGRALMLAAVGTLIGIVIWFVLHGNGAERGRPPYTEKGNTFD